MEQIGYLVPFSTGNKVICTACKENSSLYSHLETPLFIENLGRYQQHCIPCGKSINPNANENWPELFDGK